MSTIEVYKCRLCQGALHVPSVDELVEIVISEGDERPYEKVVESIRGIVARYPPTLCDRCYSEQEAAAERETRARQFEEQVRHAGLPAELRGLTWADMWETSDKRKLAIVAAEKWAGASQPRGLYLWGAAGTGKTRLAATALLARLHGRPGRWVSVAHLLARLDSSFSDKERQVALDVLAGDTALVLDDLDKTTASEAKRAQLFVAIDRRITANAALLFTCNLPPQKLEEKFGEAIASRVLGYSLGRVVELDGADNRLRLDV